MDFSQSVGACLICRSTKYHKTDQGFLVCEFGHQSQRFCEEQDDNDNYFGTTRKLATRKSRPSQVVDDEADVQILRSGETEAFAMIEVVQVLLRQQIKDLKQLIPSLSEDFEQTVKTIWLAYISIFEINYEEEGVKELLPSQIARRESQVSLLSTSQLSRRDSQISLALSGITDNDDMDLSENDLDFSLNQLADAALMVNHAGHLKKMGRRTAQLSNSLLILSLGILHHKIPLYTYDILRLALAGKISFFNVSQLVPKDLAKQLTRAQKAYIRSPKFPSGSDLGANLVVIGRLLLKSTGIPLPMIDSRLILWRIGELLTLPYLYREDIIALSVKLNLEYTVGVVHERFPSNPFCLAFALIIFYLKLHYGLTDFSIRHQENKRFTASGFPTHYQLQEAWRSILTEMKLGSRNDLSGVVEQLDLYKKIVIPSLAENVEKEEEFDYKQMKRSLKISDIENALERKPESRPAWLITSPEQEIEITDHWSKNYLATRNQDINSESSFTAWSESTRILIEIGGMFCCVKPSSIEWALNRLAETVVATSIINSHYA